jgi:hypothetical protein
MALDERAVKAAEHADLESTEVAKHLHGNEVWFGDAASPDAGVHEADKDSLVSFQVDAGNRAWGTAINVLGTSDTPSAAGMTKWDCHKVLVITTERANILHYLRFTFGASEAAGITAGNSTVIAFYTTTVKSTAIEFMAKRAAAGEKLWVAAKCDENTGTVNFIFGLHEYAV